MSDIKKHTIQNILQKRWVNHIMFWLLLLAFYTKVNTVYNDAFYKVLVHNVIMLVPQILASYFIAYFLIPKLLYKKKYLLFFVSFAMGCYFFSALARVLVVHIIEELYREPPFTQESIYDILTDLKHMYKYYFFSVFLPAFLFVSIKLLKERFEEKSKQEILKKEKVSAELNFFKAQIHPHFLFNTLNNLYVLTLQKSDKASEIVLKLSEMLDYMLYQCKDDRVIISKELKLLENYVDLEQLRYGERLELVFNQDIDNSQTQIAPLILMSLIENAFKHGTSGSVSNPTIKIDIKIEKEQLNFSVYNTKSKIKQNDKTNFKEGIGLSNTKSQLQLLYPDKHQLEIIEEDLSYHVKLHVDLA